LVDEGDAADGAVEARRMAVAIFGMGLEAEDGRAVRWILVGRVEVANEAVAQHGAMSDAGWRRTQKARAGRRVLVESIVFMRDSFVRLEMRGFRVCRMLFESTMIFQKFRGFLAGNCTVFFN
jgi:hypothetical protein